ncbi:3980_t:CDS:2, partial [Acaulospora colombiana]
VKCLPQSSIERTRNKYEEALKDINRYMKEIDTPGKFSAKTIAWLKQIANADKWEKKLKKRQRPSPFSEDTPEQYKKLVEQAWDHDFNSRPSIKKMKKQLKNIKNDENELRILNRNDSETSLSSAMSIDVPVVPNKKNNSADAPSPKSLNIYEAISLHNRGQYKEALPHFKSLAQNGNPEAAYYAGLYFYEGTYGIGKDEIRALLFLGRSAEGDYARGQYLYAHACLKGTYHSEEEESDFPVSNDDYMYYLQKAAENGSKEAQKD